MLDLSFDSLSVSRESETSEKKDSSQAFSILQRLVLILKAEMKASYFGTVLGQTLLFSPLQLVVARQADDLVSSEPR